MKNEYTTLFSLNDVPPLHNGTCVTIGNFDGVHLGHQELIRRTVTAARARGLTAVLITFDPHPLAVLFGKTPPAQLTTLHERLELFKALGIDIALVLPFTKELAALSADDFCRSVLCERLHARQLFIGYDFTLGKGRGGDAHTLAATGLQLGFTVEQLAPITANGENVSSSRIRHRIREGRVNEIPALMGRPYAVSGTVVHGFKRGSTLLGFPTANIEPDGILLPAAGAYAVTVSLPAATAAPMLTGVASVGHNPTFGTNALTLEVHILDFSADIYGQPIRAAFIERLRDERAFPSVDALVEQIRNDITATRDIIAQNA